MLYKDFLREITSCPFCEPVFNRIIQEEQDAFLTYSIAPYHKHHLLVIPKDHIEHFQDLTTEVTQSVEKLLHIWVNLLRSLGYEDYTILVRNWENVRKSIRHLHYHIVPATIIGDLDHQGQSRITMSEKEIDELMSEFQKHM
jgi:histidine triad (HIT) family protein